MKLIPSTGGVASPFMDHAGSDAHPAWSPDGAHIAFRSLRSGNADVWIKPLTGCEAGQAALETAAGNCACGVDVAHR